MISTREHALVAGVDSSTQSCKIVIRDASSGRLIRSGTAQHPPGTEVSAERWWEALLAAIDAAGGIDDVAAVSIAGQQHGMVALDADGELIRDALLWNDTRSAAAAQELIEELGATELATRTGLVPVASFTITKLRWLRDHEPANLARVAAVALPHDYLTWRLLGYGPHRSSPRGPDLDALITDRSDASGTGYWSPTTGDYDLDLFHHATGRRAHPAGETAEAITLPRVIGATDLAGRTVLNGVIPAGIAVGAGAGDNAGAALGVDARTGDLIVSIGTSGTVFGVSPTPVIDPSGVVAGFADAADGYLPLIATLNGARVLASISTLLDVDYTGLAALAETSEPGSGGVTLVPHFEGERTPNLPHATATLAGLTLASTTRANVARAAIEGMLSGLAEGAAAVIAAGVDAHRVILIGGAAQNAAVQKTAAQIFAVPIVVPAPDEYVANGAARQAARTLGSDIGWADATVTEMAPDTRPEITSRYTQARQLGSLPALR